jgi:hypothetical protein
VTCGGVSFRNEELLEAFSGKFLETFSGQLLEDFPGQLLEAFQVNY